jgi:anti-anti-sigma factor
MDNGLRNEIGGGLEVEVFPERDCVIVAPRGEIDLATVDRIRDRLNELEGGGFRCIVLDLRQVTFIDSTGVKLVLEEVKKDGIDFALIPGPAQAQRIFEITGLLKHVRFIAPAGAPAGG